MQSLGEQIQAARNKKNWTQDYLVGEIGTSKQWISTIEQGKRLPSLELLAKLHKALVAPQDPDPPLIIWLLQWLAESAPENHDHEEKIAIQKAVEEAISKLSHTATFQPRAGSRSLVDFPRAFYPLTIVCGDRREPSPHTRGDIFAYSLAVTDLMFLPWLGLEQSVNIRSDKLFVLMDDEYLRHTFGQTNLLIIGSPAVNFAARTVNKHCVFQFDLAPEMATWENYLNSRTLPKDRDYLEVFWEMAQSPNKPVNYKAILDRLPPQKRIPEQKLKELADLVEQLLGRGSPKDFMNKFRKPGIVDPADEVVHAQATRIDNDFAVISLARNPFAPPNSTDFVCIMAAGIHGPGTAHAVRALSQQDLSFQDHPLGGIIEVALDPFKDWPTRFEQAAYAWQTRPYKPEKVRANLDQAIKQPIERRGALAHLGESTLRDSLEFVKDLTRASSS
jgi:transcriptional regulator with XRE-family HTH domain